MVDARLPGPWLHRPEYWELSDHAWRVFTHGLMWSADNGTDGRIPPAFLTMLHRAGVPEEVADELVGRGHWERTADGGFQVIDWSGRKGQSTDAEVQGYLARKRANQAAYRARLAAKAAAAAPPVPGRVTGHSARRVTGQVGAARPGGLSSVSSPPPDQGGGGDETRHSPRVRAGARETPPGPKLKPATCDQPQHTRVELSAAGVCWACRAEQVGDDTRWDREDQARRASAPSRAAAPVPARTPAAAPAAVAPAPVPPATPVTAPAPVPAPVPTAPPGLHLVTASRRGRPRPQTNPPWRQLALRLFVQPAALAPSGQIQPGQQPVITAA
ncbi:hypothetical protein MXD62_16635 [Frankia sp. Mgl5]|uniref:hypothetical protein n=1 Tax=Frankia sp. Mgl5 TaxID=2933793 RepID=UPI00200C230D|nr:hypothetical protein [Frankia sp. Mgl5]MCK9928783.1 hypothetical protein [Frankia sp. Mgl5]